MIKNILSFLPGTPILGSEIRAWFNYHSENLTSHSKEARFMKKRFDNLNDNYYYRVILAYENSGCGNIVKHKPLIVKVR